MLDKLADTGCTLAAACKGLVSRRAFYHYYKNCKEAREQLEEARDWGAETLLDEMMDVVKNKDADPLCRRVQAQSYQFVIQRNSKIGNKHTVQHTGPSGEALPANPFIVQVVASK